jgi:hypothetical protein
MVELWFGNKTFVWAKEKFASCEFFIIFEVIW